MSKKIRQLTSRDIKTTLRVKLAQKLDWPLLHKSIRESKMIRIAESKVEAEYYDSLNMKEMTGEEQFELEQHIDILGDGCQKLGPPLCFGRSFRW